MKRLIVNADDLGADAGRNEGIFEAIQAGAVASVSILPNGPALDGAIARIRDLDPDTLSCGIHFNLSEGAPLSPGLRRLTGPDGSFLGKREARRLLTGPIQPDLEDEIHAELDAQISSLLDAEVPLDHVDGHQHTHILPAAIEIVIAVAKSRGIRWIRVPEETASQFGALPEDEIQEAHFFCAHAAAARPLFLKSGLWMPHHFRGLYFKGRLPDSHWPEFMQSIPHGITELMVHPGRVSRPDASGPFSRFSTHSREKELLSLTDGKFHEALLQSGVNLSRFPSRELPCES